MVETKLKFLNHPRPSRALRELETRGQGNHASSLRMKVIPGIWNTLALHGDSLPDQPSSPKSQLPLQRLSVKTSLGHLNEARYAAPDGKHVANTGKLWSTSDSEYQRS